MDEQQVNLTRFSLFFPEKREFFLEGRGIFDFARGANFGQQGAAAPCGPIRRPAFFGGGGNAADALLLSRRIGLEAGAVGARSSAAGG